MRIVNNNPLLGMQRTTSHLQRIAGRLAGAQERAITGIAVSRPSDAPGRWEGVHGLRADRADQEVWQHNLGRASDVLDVAEGVLGSASDTVQRAWERAIQLSSEVWDTQTRQEAAQEVAGLREELLGYANTRVGDRGLFSGDAWGGDAFDAAGAYVGAAATQAARIGRDSDVLLAIDGSAVFGGGVDVFATLADLEAALAADDPAAVGATLPGLQEAFEQIVGARQEVGYRQARVNDAVVVTEGLAALLDERLYEATAADPATAYTELASLTTSYEAALQVTAQSSGARLFDLLR
jgi:flagellar hook-associated protein 3 FlgL